MQSIPKAIGPFAFDAPYGETQGIRLTNASNAPQGCQPRLYPYSCVINNHRNSLFLYVVIGRIGVRPLLLRVSKTTGYVESQSSQLPEGTGENWYFSDTLPTQFYYLDGPSLRRYDVSNGQNTLVFILERGHHLWQASSSSDDSVHAATVKDAQDQDIACVVYRNGQQKFENLLGLFDECKVDKSGEYLCIQERVDDDPRNRIIQLFSGRERIITDKEGALAHWDMGRGIMMGEDDQHEPSALVQWDLRDPSIPRKPLHETIWGVGMGHVAYRDNGILLSSNATNELLLQRPGSPWRPVAPGMIERPPGAEPYDYQLRACFDPLGEYACWIALIDGRFDAILAKLPNANGAPPIIVPPNPPNPKPGGSTMKQLTTFMEPDGKVHLRTDSGSEFDSRSASADGRPAQVIDIEEALVAPGHGAGVTLNWDGKTQFFHGFLRPSSDGQAEFIPNIYTKPEGF